ncbi:putative syntaxin binding protein 1 [Leptomonas seymouri]|uniref:Putative syntaxin binding protein 1 n=1 Tax=Leptomonas seymouri TaxID=5684 RepID=A0A0N1HUY7_LEPSE|nr:putative syntaxin binding protein 1 [Leptomonas seymouri]|eukprot:KPI84218.1 putative syntaxin binding protein 1 [Leptomonas seymouri]
MLRPGSVLAEDGKAGGVASPATTASPVSFPESTPSGAKATPAGLPKKVITVRRGLLGCVRQRIFTDMLDCVHGDYNILVCDNKGAEVLSTCVRMRDLMDHGVTLVEDLSLPRQPILSSAAIYLIEPVEESVRLVMQDWALKNMYREAHVFFTFPAPDSLIQLMASEPRLVEELKTCKDMLLDFAVPETLLFSFEMPGDIPKLFPPDVALSGGRENILGQTARRLVSVFFTIGAGVPTVRYQGTSRLAQQVARLFSEQISATARSNASAARLLNSDAGGTAESEEPPLLILVDRSFDAVEPLLHERTYQCLLNDLMPLENGIYQQTFEGRAGQDGTRSCPIDEQDPYWCQYRHHFLPVCLEEIPRKLQELIAANPSLANGMGTLAGGGNKLADVGSAVRALPEFQERQAKLSVHIDICTKIMDLYKKQKLAEVCEVEQDIATGRSSFKEVYDSVRRLAADVSLPLAVRARLLLLLCAGANTREFTEAKKLMLLQEAGLASEADRCNSLNMFISRMGLLPPEKAEGSDGADGGKRAGSPSSKGNTLGSLMRRSVPTSPAAKNNANGSPTDTSARAGGSNSAGDTFRSQAYLILKAAANNTLSLSDFPRFTGVSNAGLAGVANAGRGTAAAGSGLQRRTLRSGAYSNDAQNRNVAMNGAGGESKIMLDLGHEGQFALKSRQRVVLFVLGGATYGEVRAGYEISKLMHTEAMVGGTSMLTPAKFLSALTSLR